MKFKLPNPHNHQGVQYQTGDIIDISPEKYEWLVKAITKLRGDNQEALSKIQGTSQWAQALNETAEKNRAGRTRKAKDKEADE